MDILNLLLSITPSPVLSVLLWLIVIMLGLYVARNPFHKGMNALGLLIYHALRLTSFSLKLADKRLQTRNREVLLSSGMEMAERKVEREFERISAVVQRDMEGYPKIQRDLNETLIQLENDYQACAEIPQTLPDWVKVIDAVANIKPTGDRMVVNMLEQIHETLVEQHKTAAENHRQAMSKRHTILNRMMPGWRRVRKTLDGVQSAITNLTQRSKKIDRYMGEYEKILSQSDTAVRQLSSSSLAQFFISGLVLAVAVVGAIINFNLVALPMSEMVGGSSYIGYFKTSDVAGMFIVCLEIVVGVFLMDALRITRLFSIIGSLEDKKRQLIFWILLGMLTILALVESSLAYMRDQIAGDIEALRQSLAGVEVAEVAKSNIPTYGQMIMGFILPFILTFVAIPFESFVASSRTMLGIVASGVLRVLAYLMRLLGSLGYYLVRLIANIYDLVISPALWVESIIVRLTSKSVSGPNEKQSSETGEDNAQPVRAEG